VLSLSRMPPDDVCRCLQCHLVALAPAGGRPPLPDPPPQTGDLVGWAYHELSGLLVGPMDEDGVALLPRPPPPRPPTGRPQLPWPHHASSAGPLNLDRLALLRDGLVPADPLGAAAFPPGSHAATVVGRLPPRDAAPLPSPPELGCAVAFFLALAVVSDEARNVDASTSAPRRAEAGTSGGAAPPGFRDAAASQCAEDGGAVPVALTESWVTLATPEGTSTFLAVREPGTPPHPREMRAAADACVAALSGWPGADALFRILSGARREIALADPVMLRAISATVAIAWLDAPAAPEVCHPAVGMRLANDHLGHAPRPDAADAGASGLGRLVTPLEARARDSPPTWLSAAAAVGPRAAAGAPSRRRDAVPCADENPRCLQWARDGECLANPSYMLMRCPQSCDLCPPDGAAGGGEGTSSRMAFWGALQVPGRELEYASAVVGHFARRAPPPRCFRESLPVGVGTHSDRAGVAWVVCPGDRVATVDAAGRERVLGRLDWSATWRDTRHGPVHALRHRDASRPPVRLPSHALLYRRGTRCDDDSAGSERRTEVDVWFVCRHPDVAREVPEIVVHPRAQGGDLCRRAITVVTIDACDIRGAGVPVGEGGGLGVEIVGSGLWQ